MSCFTNNVVKSSMLPTGAGEGLAQVCRVLIVDILKHRGSRESQSAVDGVLRCCRSAGTVQTGVAVPCCEDTYRPWCRDAIQFVESININAVTVIGSWRTVDYYSVRCRANLQIIDNLDFIGETSEFARIFGIEFYHAISRGSQVPTTVTFRVLKLQLV